MEAEPIHPMETLKLGLRQITEVIPPGSKIVYLDYPVHNNVGDLLIMKGTEAFFKAYGIQVMKRYCLHHFRRIRIPPGWIIVCHGGGNFGDLYPHYQQFRELIVRMYPDRRIVALPQTVYFEDPEEQRRSLEVFAGHPDFHLFVRDEVSFRIAQGSLVRLYLSPDMAHQLYPLRATNAGGTRVLGLMRTDKEIALHPIASLPYDRVTDWPKLLSSWDNLLLRVIWKAYAWDRHLGNLLPMKLIWYRYADRLISKAIRLYDGYGSVVSSRLHGHILACLMNKPNQLIDNAYGKNGSYYRLWTCNVSNVESDIPAGRLFREGVPDFGNAESIR